MKCNLLQHQIEGYSWMTMRESSVPNGGILADEQGLGKTIQSIALMLGNTPPDRDEPQLRTLIVAPVSLMSQWVAEIQKFSKCVCLFCSFFFCFKRLLLIAFSL
jgi:SNF2 family DNA or RNA helicase